MLTFCTGFLHILFPRPNSLFISSCLFLFESQIILFSVTYFLLFTFFLNCFSCFLICFLFLGFFLPVFSSVSSYLFVSSTNAIIQSCLFCLPFVLTSFTYFLLCSTFSYLYFYLFPLTYYHSSFRPFPPATSPLKVAGSKRLRS